MQRPKLSCLVVLSVCAVLAACSENPPQTAEAPTEISDAQRLAAEARSRLESSEGGRLVLRAIEAHGGLEAWYAAPTSSYCWEYSNVGAQLRFKSCLTADNRTRHVYHDIVSLGTPDEIQPFEGRFAWDGEKAWIEPASVEKINPRFWALTGYYFEQIPFVLADAGVRHELLPDEELDGETYAMVRCGFDAGVGDASGDTYTLYVDKESGRVAAIRYTVTYGRGASPAGKKGGAIRETLFHYDDYQTVDGLTVAGRFRGFGFEDGKIGEFKNEAWCTDISFSTPFDETKLQLPAGARIQPLPGQ